MTGNASDPDRERSPFSVQALRNQAICVQTVLRPFDPMYQPTPRQHRHACRRSPSRRAVLSATSRRRMAVWRRGACTARVHAGSSAEEADMLPGLPSGSGGAATSFNPWAGKAWRRSARASSRHRPTCAPAVSSVRTVPKVSTRGCLAGTALTSSHPLFFYGHNIYQFGYTCNGQGRKGRLRVWLKWAWSLQHDFDGTTFAAWGALK